MPNNRWVVDEARIQAYLYKRAEGVANQAAGFVLARARHHAPVRKIFKGTTYKRTELMSRYASAAGEARSPVERRALSPEGGLITGHANSPMPVFKQGRNRIAGDFRRVEITKEYDAHGASVAHKIELMKVPYEKSTMVGGRGSSLTSRSVTTATGGGAAPRAMTTANPVRSVRGRYEIKTGRALYMDAHGNDRIGGRLRGEIYIESAVREGRGVWARVVSPTPYARHMEFGTVHNRPYPFLRPALHESRERFRRYARNAFRSIKIDVGTGDVSD